MKFFIFVRDRDQHRSQWEWFASFWLAVGWTIVCHLLG
ncbi:hypothetical protein JOE51_001489 [Bradyrhizobium japonicum]|nr:hypothetical protein [Bradyrhizobium japonicum]